MSISELFEVVVLSNYKVIAQRLLAKFPDATVNSPEAVLYYAYSLANSDKATFKQIVKGLKFNDNEPITSNYISTINQIVLASNNSKSINDCASILVTQGLPAFIECLANTGQVVIDPNPTPPQNQPFFSKKTKELLFVILAVLLLIGLIIFLINQTK